MKKFEIDNVIIKLGATAQENWDLIDESNEDFWWIHLAAFPSGHVIIEEDSPSDKIIQYAGEICKNHTKYRNMRNLKISVTQCKNLIKGEKKGEVRFKSNRKVKHLLISR